MQSISIRSVGVVAAMTLLCSCSLIEWSGKMTRKTGEAMTDYSKENDGVIGKAAGFGGSVNTAVGTAVENSATSGKSDKAETASVNTKDMVVKAQRRLNELGFPVGSPDGVLGAKSKAALGQFQSKNGLEVTNALDQPTLSALGIAD